MFCVIISLIIREKSGYVQKSLRTEEYNSNILSLVLQRHKKSNEALGAYWYNDNSVFKKILKILNEIAFYFTMLLNAILISNYSTQIDLIDGISSKVGFKVAYQNALRTFLIGSVILIVAYVFRKLIKRISFSKKVVTFNLLVALITIIGAVVLFSISFSVLIQGNIDSIYAEAVDAKTPFEIYMKWILCHIIPCFILAFSNLMFYIMKKKDFDEINALYEDKIKKIYREFTTDNPSYSQEMWNNHLDNYTEEIIIEKRNKKSKKNNKKRVD